MGGRCVKLTADTNVLVRALVQDDVEHARAAQALLSRATVIAVPVPVFCELAWVLKRAYARGAEDIAVAIDPRRQEVTVNPESPNIPSAVVMAPTR